MGVSRACRAARYAWWCSTDSRTESNEPNTQPHCDGVYYFGSGKRQPCYRLNGLVIEFIFELRLSFFVGTLIINNVIN